MCFIEIYKTLLTKENPNVNNFDDSRINNILRYTNKDNKDEFINSTINCDMSYQYNLFEKFFSLGYISFRFDENYYDNELVQYTYKDADNNDIIINGLSCEILLHYKYDDMFSMIDGNDGEDEDVVFTLKTKFNNNINKNSRVYVRFFMRSFV